jgi:hypothetical protein
MEPIFRLASESELLARPASTDVRLVPDVRDLAQKKAKKLPPSAVAKTSFSPA